MVQVYKPTIEALDDRTVLDGGFWSLGQGLGELLERNSNQHSGGTELAANVSSHAELSSSANEGSAWSAFFSSWMPGKGSKVQSNDAVAASAQPAVTNDQLGSQSSAAVESLPELAKTASASSLLPGTTASTANSLQSLLQRAESLLNSLAQSAKSILDEIITQIGHAMSSSSDWVQDVFTGIGGLVDNTQDSGGQDSNGPGVHWPFGGSNWPSWLPNFGNNTDQQAGNTDPPPVQNLPTNNAGPVVTDNQGSETQSPNDGGENGNAQDDEAHPAVVIRDSSPATDEKSSANPSASDNSEGDEETQLEGVVLSPANQKLAEGGNSDATDDAPAVTAGTESAVSDSAAPVHSAEETAAVVSEAADAEAELEIAASVSPIDVVAEAFDATAESAAESALWLADLVSAFAPEHSWSENAVDLFDALPISLESSEGTPLMGAPPIALVSSMAFAVGALYWRRSEKRRSSASRIFPVDDFFTDLAVDSRG